MASNDAGYSFDLSVEDFDKNVLPSHARTPGTDEFAEEVNKFFEKEFADFPGRIWIIVDAKNIRVSWHSDPNDPDPMQVIYSKLERGEFEQAIRLLEILRRYQPDNFVILQNLGMALKNASLEMLVENGPTCLSKTDPPPG